MESKGLKILKAMYVAIKIIKFITILQCKLRILDIGGNKIKVLERVKHLHVLQELWVRKKCVRGLIVSDKCRQMTINSAHSRM